MINVKELLGIIAVGLTFAAYIPYLKDIRSGKTKPHLYSWFLWGFVTLIAFALQVSGGAGIGALVTLSAALMCIVVIALGFYKKNKVEATRTDTLFLILAFISLLLWLVAKQPILSAILITLTDLFGFAPTVRKSWKDPYSETLSFYIINTIRFTLAVVSLQKYGVITAFYPVVWLLANGLFALMLYIRRRIVIMPKFLNK